MPSPSNWSDPGDHALGQQRRPREHPCAWCAEPATLPTRWAIGDQVRLSVPICNACAAGAAIGDFTISIKVMDRVRVLRGADLPAHNGHAHW